MINSSELLELAACLIGYTEDKIIDNDVENHREDIEKLFYDKYDVDIDQIADLIEDLIRFTIPAKTIGGYSQGFAEVENKRFIIRKKYNKE